MRPRLRLFTPGVPAARALAYTTALALSTLDSGAPAVAAPAVLHSDQFRILYEVPKERAHQALYEELKSKRTLEKFREFLSFIRLPRILTLKLAGCDGEENAWYEPEDLTITVCYEYVEAVRKLAPTSPTPAGATPENAVLGPLAEVFLHEVGHALFDQLRIPILGREEDAADQFAAYVLVHLSPQSTRDAIAGVAWMYGQEAKGEQLNPSSLANVHGLSGQRFYNTLCIAYGAEPGVFNDLIERKLLPKERAETCEDEYAQVAFAIRTLMSRYIDVSAQDKVLAKDWAGGKARKKTTRGNEPK
jgi:Putative metallopeptidase